MVFNIVLIVIGLVLLIKGADWLVNGASAIAKKFQVPDMVIGLTIVAFGTSLPELIVSLLAAIAGNSDLSVGNITGSNIANILLILGVAGVIVPIPVARKTLVYEIPYSAFVVLVFMFLAAFTIGTNTNASQLQINRTEAAILLLCFAAFMVYTIKLSKDGKKTAIDTITESAIKIPAQVALIIVGIIGLVLGGKLVVDNAVNLAKMAGWSERFIGLSILAVGTSLPELATTVVAAYRKKADIAIGNVVGSNIFNIVWIIGLTALIKPINISGGVLIDLGMVLVATLMLVIALISGKPPRLKRMGALIFLITYFGYLTYLYLYQ